LLLARTVQAAADSRWDDAYRWNSRALRVAEHLYQQPFLLEQWTGAQVERLALQQFAHLLKNSLPQNHSTILRDFRAREKNMCPAEVVAAADNLYSYDLYERLLTWASDASGSSQLNDALAGLLMPIQTFIDADSHEKAAKLEAARQKLRATTLQQTWDAHRKLIAINAQWMSRPFHELWKDREAYLKQYAQVESGDPVLSAMAGASSQFGLDCTNQHYIPALTRTMRNAAAT